MLNTAVNSCWLSQGDIRNTIHLPKKVFKIQNSNRDSYFLTKIINWIITRKKITCSQYQTHCPNSLWCLHNLKMCKLFFMLLCRYKVYLFVSSVWALYCQIHLSLVRGYFLLHCLIYLTVKFQEPHQSRL